MSTGLLVAIIIIVAAVVVLGAIVMLRQQRTRRLRDRFGPEYERTLARTGDRRAGETELSEREQHRRQLRIVDLEPAERVRYQEAWQATQAKFVDDPVAATREADQLVSSVMRDRGYPVDDFEQRAADISVDHPQVAESYRAAHAVSLANERGLAGTDDLRQAFVHYRSLFSELLDGHQGRREEAASEEVAHHEETAHHDEIVHRDEAAHEEGVRDERATERTEHR